VSKTFSIISTLVALIFVISACVTGPQLPTLSEQESLGQRLFTQSCAACHAQAGEGVIVGPSLAGIKSVAATRITGMDSNTYIEQSILQPDAFINEGFDNLMPGTFGATLTSEEIAALIAYLLVLK
jgi:mono/diheme cytochrome c family protein